MRPVQLTSFPAFAGSSVLDGFVRGLPLYSECRKIRVEIEGTIRNQAAATAALAVADMNVIATAIAPKIRLTYNDKTDAWNVTPSELRSIAGYASGRDTFTELMKPGVFVIPSSASGVLAFKIPLTIPFTFRGLENPNVFCPSAAQLNRDGTKVTIETGALAALTGLVLANATVNVVVTGLKIYCAMAPTVVDSKGTKVDFVAPTIYCRSRTVSAFPDTERGPMLDLLLADERPFTTVAVNVSNYTVEHDGIAAPRNAPPDTLVAEFENNQGSVDGNLPIRIADPLNGLGSQAGAQISPLTWLDGGVRSAEHELPIYMEYRAIVANLVAGGAASTNFLYLRVAPADEAIEVIKQLLLLKGMNDIAYSKLAVKGGGGGDNALFSLFKPRWLALAG